MARHLVTYDLHEPTQDYAKVIAAIKRYPSWCSVTYSTWLISTTETPAQVRDTLQKEMSANDKLLVVDTTNKAAAWKSLSQKVADWIKNH